MEIEEHILNVINFKVKKYFSNYIIETHPDYVADSLAVSMKTFLAEQKMDKIEFHAPATWWDHFKEAHFPKSLKKYFPVRYNYESYELNAWYPDLALPQEKHQFVVKRLKPFDGVIV